jgi:hypothetical protein
LPRSMSEAVHSKAPEELSPYEAVLRSFAYFERYTPEELSASSPDNSRSLGREKPLLLQTC